MFTMPARLVCAGYLLIGGGCSTGSNLQGRDTQTLFNICSRFDFSSPKSPLCCIAALWKLNRLITATVTPEEDTYCRTSRRPAFATRLLLDMQGACQQHVLVSLPTAALSSPITASWFSCAYTSLKISFHYQKLFAALEGISAARLVCPSRG